MARLGQRGEIKEVSEGYAVNVLIKKGDALQATPGEIAKLKQKEDAKKHKKEVESNAFAKLVDNLHKEKIVITGKKADSKGQLFAQIKELDVADAIFKITSFSIDPKQVTIHSPIKSLGVHQVELKQGAQKENLTVEVK